MMAGSGERGHDGNAISQVHGRVQAEGRRAVQEIGNHVRRGGARARMRPRQPVGLGEEGRRRRGARRKPVPDGRRPAQAEAREREAEEGERDTFKSERLLRQQAAAGLSAKRAEFEFIFLNEGGWPVSETCAALKTARQGCYAWKSRPPSAHAMRDAELADRTPGSGQKSGTSTARPRRSCGCGPSGLARRASGLFMRERGRRGVTRACAKRPSGEKRASKRESALEPGGAQVRGRRPQHGVVRRHHLRQDPPGLAVPGARDGHLVAAHRGMVDGPEHHGRARRRGLENGAGQAKPARGMRAPQR